ncbi:hypothetical protein Vi05172_g6978 [Venturia inaequalis]|nr:hypothetical protein Vi05172_g6978 [Venturia inaequalis]
MGQTGNQEDGNRSTNIEPLQPVVEHDNTTTNINRNALAVREQWLKQEETRIREQQVRMLAGKQQLPYLPPRVQE